jgi:hypothetical protein
MPGVSYEQLMKPTQVVRAVAKLNESSTFFQRFMKMGIKDAPAITSKMRMFGYDTYSNTRTMAPASAPMAPAPRLGLKPTGMVSVTMVRTIGSITIYDEKVFQSRPIGGSLGEVDAQGQKYIALQLNHLSTMFRNTREFMVSRMLLGGFGLKPAAGDQYRFCEATDGAATIVNDYQIPAENKGNLNGLIATLWNDPAADIVSQFLALAQRMARTSGYSPSDVMCDSGVIAPLFNNTGLSKVRGTANRIFDTFSKKPLTESDAKSSAMFSIVFGGLPWITFHVINDGLNLDELVPNESNQILLANFTQLVPPKTAIILPPVDGIWCGYAQGCEPVRETVMDMAPKEVTGFGVWRTPAINPGRFDVTAVDNGIPCLFLPRAVNVATVLP